MPLLSQPPVPVLAVRTTRNDPHLLPVRPREADGPSSQRDRPHLFYPLPLLAFEDPRLPCWRSRRHSQTPPTAGPPPPTRGSSSLFIATLAIRSDRRGPLSSFADSGADGRVLVGSSPKRLLVGLRETTRTGDENRRAQLVPFTQQCLLINRKTMQIFSTCNTTTRHKTS